ncbi:thioredoxin family protein [Gloeocapsopsis dulcis]|uniref:Thiol:disulfide interchange protein n=1 Tax=Gloeocapsopsis dulcis AAB1 = 1H9 TaxID=1433147 RepID=A0A6N8G198_9CHRO|nr:thioredoxin family protein [Gloeocapsopsis dulcis]MUL38137.1 thiol:disulfide interchange protein [Gloeocapsopsis dulcis AAB1 = 1H9]WNN89399.1 thioredoxin family protein [Gloeocapsopsis dulcis]
MSVSSQEANTGKRVRNFLIVLVAIALSVALFLGLRNQTSAVSLTHLDEEAVPLEVALTNGKPSLMEFYANWCTSCQAMAPDIAQLKQEYGESVNFVMLNVDNSKWLPEILHYRVDGIPHFVFLNKEGEAIAQSVGEQPRMVMATNLDALVADSPLPYAQHSSGQVSKFTAPVTPADNADNPRLHGSQVVN